MMTTPVLPMEDVLPFMGQSRKIGANDESMVNQKSSKSFLSSIQQCMLPNDMPIVATASSCSIKTEYCRSNEDIESRHQGHHEEGRQEKESVAIEYNDREESDSRDRSIDPKRDESPLSTEAFEKVVNKPGHEKDSDDASKGSKTKKILKKVKQLKRVISVPKAISCQQQQQKQRASPKAKDATATASRNEAPSSSVATKPKPIATGEKNVTANILTTPLMGASPAEKDPCWTGRVVGLRLPSNVDSDFDSKCKPTDRRVDPSKYLVTDKMGSEKVPKGADGWNPWNDPTNITDGNYPNNAKKLNAIDYDAMIAGNNRSTKATSIALDVYLFNQNDTSTKPIKIHMTRDPNEEVSKTLTRLQLSVQKKLGGKKKKQKKSKKASEQGKGSENNEALLFRERVHVERALDEDKMAVGTPTLWDEFYDAVLPINVCNPWSEIQLDNNREQLEGGSNDAYVSDNRNMLEGYKRVEYAKSLTISEVLNQAATMADDLGRYVFSVPIATATNNTARIPLMIDSCPPTITSVATFGSFQDSHIFEKTPIVVEVEFIYASKVQIMWFADQKPVWADSPCYTPTKADVGKVLTVVIIPTRSNHDGRGCGEAYQFKRRVEALPSLPLVRPLREEFLNRPQRQHNHPDGDRTLRVVTYNILADQNASRDVDKDDDANRMYSHCKNEHIVKWRRHPLIIHELLEYRPDVITLQEVDTDVFIGLLKPVLSAKGYEGYYSQKGVDAASGVREGCAIFWSLDVFESVRPVDMRSHSFRDLIQQFMCDERMHQSQWKSLKDMADLLDKHDHLKHVLFNKLGHVLQTVVLTERESKEKLVIGNSHLFYHPMASHIRCLKILIACRQLEIEHKENQHCPMIFCGDFNSHPNSGVMKLLLNRFLESNNGKTWKHLCSYEWEEGMGGELRHDVEAIDLEFPPSFPGFVSAYPEPPDFTHFIEAFVCTLDYILMTNNFVLEKSGATPSREDIKKYVAMPNECMPSDHVSLVCDLKWR